MATRGAQTHLIPEEYITLERKAIPDAETVRSEYINGEIINMPRECLSKFTNAEHGILCF